MRLIIQIILKTYIGIDTALFVAERLPRFAKQIKPSINGLLLPLILGFFISKYERR